MFAARLVGVFFLLYVALLIGASVPASMPGGWLALADGRQVVFRRPMRRRIFYLLVIGLFVFGAAFSTWLGLTRIRPPAPLGERLFYVLVFDSMLLGLARFLLPLAGPSELRLDLQQGTYRYAPSWPWLSPPWAGLITDIAGMSVTPRESSYVPLVVWRRRGDRSTLLGNFRTREDAEQFAQEAAALSGLPVIKAP